MVTHLLYTEPDKPTKLIKILKLFDTTILILIQSKHKNEWLLNSETKVTQSQMISKTI